MGMFEYIASFFWSSKVCSAHSTADLIVTECLNATIGAEQQEFCAQYFRTWGKSFAVQNSEQKVKDKM